MNLFVSLNHPDSSASQKNLSGKGDRDQDDRCFHCDPICVPRSCEWVNFEAKTLLLSSQITRATRFAQLIQCIRKI